jgi:hypothetical protein
MTDGNFERWMERLAAEAAAEDAAKDAAAPIPDSAAIWWRAQLRQRMADRYRVTKPLRVAERAAGVLCFAAAVAVGARLGVAGVAPFIVVTLVAAAGATAFVLRGAE